MLPDYLLKLIKKYMTPIPEYKALYWKKRLTTAYVTIAVITNVLVLVYWAKHGPEYTIEDTHKKIKPGECVRVVRFKGLTQVDSRTFYGPSVEESEEKSERERKPILLVGEPGSPDKSF